jgi:hypothetical protein
MLSPTKGTTNRAVVTIPARLRVPIFRALVFMSFSSRWGFVEKNVVSGW